MDISDSALVGIDELHARLDDPLCTVIDCRFDLIDPQAGHAAFLESHIPGAHYADLDHDLAGPVNSSGGGRHPLPAPAAFQSTIDQWGIAPESRVVCYDGAGGAVASRLWWLLRWFGLGGAAVLDGGWAAWLGAGLPVESIVPPPRRGGFVGRPGRMPVIDAAGVERRLTAGSLLLVDARAAERFAGRTEPLDKVAGHVPGAVNVPFQSNLSAHGRFLDAERLREIYAPLVANRAADDVACMCGSGVTACHTLLALERAGWHGAALYVGSWSDWISADRPIATE